ncbi:hypothetical protein ACQEV4_19150 [Streptomyces shenzhenensis]|uniref:hypothetical protein n=1 Tax=Streptomyces shenzhenensis TaxID=943815 RepID=UPI003D9244BF
MDAHVAALRGAVRQRTGGRTAEPATHDEHFDPVVVGFSGELRVGVRVPVEGPVRADGAPETERLRRPVPRPP